MIFWKSEKDRENEEKRKAAVKALESGDITPTARERLEQQAAIGEKFFTSDLTTKEFITAREAGYEPVGMVMGSSFYKVGFGIAGGYKSGRGGWSWGYSSELKELTQARLAASRTAIGRLKKEAELLGANGLVGVRLKTKSYGWSEDLIEFTAVGTAIKVPGFPSQGVPLMSELDGQEFWQLYKSGYYPNGIVYGVCSYYVWTDPDTRRLTQNWWGGANWQNQEIAKYTEAFYFARHKAMERLSEDLVNHKADGCVSMEVDHELEEVEYERNDVTYRDYVVHFTALGTAVSRMNKPVQTPSTLVVYDLNTKKKRAIDYQGFQDELNK